MFDQYTHFTANKTSDIQAVYRCSGFAELQEIISHMSNVKLPCLVVEDAPDIGVNLEDKSVERQMLGMYVLVKANKKGSEDANRAAAYAEAFALGKAQLKAMNLLYPKYTLERDTIHAFATGPMPHSSFGYGFNYVVKEQ